MDIMMPDMDGFEAMRTIRSQARFRSLPILALTAKAMKEDKQKCIDAGANDYVTKPIDVDKLLSLMRVWLSK
jgi:CheY-like chemotaxis protein